MLERQLQAKKNISLLTCKKILYIEDSLGIGVYSSLINMILKTNKITVISLNTKNNVKKRYIELKEDSTKNHAFLVDLDYDLFLNEPIIKDNCFFYLGKYTFENYIIEENIGANIISLRENIDFNTALDKLNYQNWKTKLIETYSSLIPLFLAIRNLKSAPVETSKADPRLFFNMADFNLDSTQVRNYLNRIPKEFKCGSEICKNIKIYNHKLDKSNVFSYIPGKQLLKLYISNINLNLKKHISETEYKTIAIINSSNDLTNIIKKIGSYLL